MHNISNILVQVTTVPSNNLGREPGEALSSVFMAVIIQ